MRTTRLASLALVAAFAGSAGASPRQGRFVGIHPIPPSAGGGFCEIEAPHVHVFEPGKLEYRAHEGYHFFVGDPVAYGYDGPRHQYKGHHPIHVHAVVGDAHEDVEFCYLDGPHFHAFTPAVEAEFKLVGDTYFYVAEPPPIYLEARPAHVKINAVYAPLRYQRPVVTVEPPVGWIGVRAGFGVPVAAVGVHGGVDVVAPVVVGPRVRAEVVVPAPSLEVNIGLGVGIGGEVHHHHGHGHKHGHKHKHKKHKHKHDNGRHRGWGKKRSFF